VDVAGATLLQSNEDAVVSVDYNFAGADDVQLTVEEAGGLDVTNEIVDSTNPITDTTGSVTFDLDPQDVSTGTYTFTVEGADDLDFGDATQSTTVTIADDESASIALGSTSVIQGEDVTFTVTGVQEGSEVTVAVEQSDMVDSTSNPFRDVGDTDSRNDDSTNYTATLTIDDGEAVGAIDTQALDTTDVTIEVYPGSSVSGDEDDSVDLEVTSGEVTLDSPTGTYVIGSKVDISGTATEGVDDVVVFAREGGDWELVTVNGGAGIEVDPDGTFSESDVTLSGTSDGNQLLSIPGSYRIGVVDRAGVDDNDDGTINGDETTLSKLHDLQRPDRHGGQHRGRRRCRPAVRRRGRRGHPRGCARQPVRDDRQRR
jgi:major cell surface glycoprotein (TIGR04216 family)